MKLKTKCPNCRVSLSLKPELVGKSVTCPGCKQPFQVQDVQVPSENSVAGASIFQDDTGAATATANGPAPDSTQPTHAGRFEIRAQLGKGGFGTVYRAFDPVLDREIALKLGHKRSTARDMERLLAEARAAARLRHPNIVAVFDVSESVDNAFIASELVSGLPLNEHTRRSECSLRDKVTWVIAISRALAHAHHQGIIHRDVKPHNIVIDESGRALLTDFGLARVENQGSDERQVLVGTPAYMSPEQARGVQTAVGPAADQYSLGVVLFELFTGRRPFDGSGPAVIEEILHGTVPDASTLAEDVPSDLNAVCHKALSRDTENRYIDCDAFADDLQRWLDGELVEASNPSLRRRLLHWGKRHPQYGAAALTALAIVIAATGISITIVVNWIIEYRDVLKEVERLRADSAAEAPQFKSDTDERFRQVMATSAYSAKLNVIRNAIQDNQLETAHDMLDRIPVSQRGIEYGLLRREALGTPLILQHGTKVDQLAWSFDGNLLVSVDQQTWTLRFWDGIDGSDLGEQKINGLRRVAFHPRKPELFLAAVGERGPQIVRLSVTRVGNRIETAVMGAVDVPLSVFDLAMHPRDEILAVGGATTDGLPGAAIIDLQNPGPRLTARPQGLDDVVTTLSFTRDGAALICATGVPEPSGRFAAHFVSVNHLTGESRDLTEDDRRKVSTAFDKHRFFDPDNDRNTRFRMDEAAPTVATGRLGELAGNDDGRITGEYGEEWIGHSCAITALATRLDQSCVASADAVGEIRLWSLQNQAPVGTAISQVAVSQDGRLAACNGQTKSGTLTLWDPLTKESKLTLAGHDRGVVVLAFHPAGSELMSLDFGGQVRIWNTSDGTLIREWTLPATSIRDAIWTADGTALVFGGVRPLTPVPANADAAAAVGATDGLILICDPETGNESGRVTDIAGVLRLAAIPNANEFAVSTESGLIEQRSASDNTVTRTWQHSGFVGTDIVVGDALVAAVMTESCAEAVAFTERQPGTSTVQFGKYGYKVRMPGFRSLLCVWNRSDGQLRYALPAERSPFGNVDLNHDGKRLLTSNWTGTVVRDAETGQALLTLAPVETYTAETHTRTITTFRTEARTATRTVMHTVEEAKVVNQDFTVNLATDILFENGQLRIPEHGIADTMRVAKVMAEADSTLPSDLSAGADYFVKVIDVDHLQIFVDRELQSPIDFSSDGVGTFIVRFQRPVTVTKTVPFTEQYTYHVCTPVLEEIPYTVANRAVMPAADICFAPNSEMLLLATTSSVRTMDAVEPAATVQFTGAGDWYTDATADPAGTQIVAVAESMRSGCCTAGILEVWDSVTGEKVRTVPLDQRPVAIAVDWRNERAIVATSGGESAGSPPTARPAGERAAVPDESRDSGSLLLIDLAQGKVVQTDPSLAGSVIDLYVDQSGDAAALLFGDGRLQTRNLLSLETTAEATLPAPSFSFESHPQQSLLLVHADAGRTFCLRPDSLQWKELPLSTPSASTVLFSEDGSHLLIRSESQQLIGVLSVADAHSVCGSGTDIVFTDPGTSLESPWLAFEPGRGLMLVAGGGDNVLARCLTTRQTERTWQPSLSGINTDRRPISAAGGKVLTLRRNGVQELDVNATADRTHRFLAVVSASGDSLYLGPQELDVAPPAPVYEPLPVPEPIQASVPVPVATPEAAEVQAAKQLEEHGLVLRRDKEGFVVAVEARGYKDGQFSDEMAPLLEQLARLQEIRIPLQQGFTAKGLESLADRSTLQRVDFGGTNVDPGSLSLLKACPLRKLQFQCVTQPLTDDHVVNLPEWPELEEFGTTGGKLTGRGAASFARYPKLRILKVNWCSMEDDFVAQLPVLLHLQRFESWRSNLSADGIASLARFPELRQISYSSSLPTEHGLEMLIGLPLERLHIEQLPAANEALPIFSKMPKLSYLRLVNCNLSVDSARILCESLGPKVRIELIGQDELIPIQKEHEERQRQQ